MKYAPRDYARAYLETKPPSADFLRVVEKNGDMGRIEKIVAAIEELVTRENGGHSVHVEFAREMPNKFVFNKKDHVRVSINPSLIAGVRVTIDGTRELDNSFKRKINTLFT